MSSDLIQIQNRESPKERPVRKPPWLRVRLSNSPEVANTRRLMRELDLHTVCEEAACPNLGECWAKGHATVMILGSICTRACTDTSACTE